MNHSQNKIKELSPLQRAVLAMNKMSAKQDAMLEAKSEPIAIVGMACRFPGADNIEAFWQNLLDGHDSIRDVPANRWSLEKYYHSDPNHRGTMYTRKGGFLDRVDLFDADFFGISPREVSHMDPQQRILLEETWHALESACIPPEILKASQTGVFVGLMTQDYPQFTYHPDIMDVHTATGGAASVAAGRIAYMLGLRGPVMTLDTACSSSLVAAHLACQSLRLKECHQAIVAGVNLMLSPITTMLECQANMLSPKGRCKTFDALADGYVRGEGCGVIILKRLSNALADGDSIVALIKGSAVNHDGAASGLTVPSDQAQKQLIQQALKNAKAKPGDVHYVEAHGTGTALGDPIEVTTLGHCYAADRGADDPLIIGSVKTNVGHLEGAAGVIGLIKSALILNRDTIPKQLHFDQPNPHIPWHLWPVKVAVETSPWPAQQKLAAVSSFGFSGTNAHAILAKWTDPDAETPLTTLPHYCLPLSAKAQVDLQAMAGVVASTLKNNPDHIQDICYAFSCGRSHYSQRMAVTGQADDLMAQLQHYHQSGVNMISVDQFDLGDQCDVTEVCWMFTGQGAQYGGMGRDLYAAEPLFKSIVDAAEVMVHALGYDYPLTAMLLDKDNDDINQTQYTQPALFILEMALARLWLSWGVRPDYLIGHSLGEYAAACIADVFSFEDGLKLVCKRAELMAALPGNGAMASLRISQKVALKAISDYPDTVSVAAINGPESVVISGQCEHLEKVVAQLSAQSVKCQMLAVSQAFHSPLVESMLDDFEAILKTIVFHPPAIPIISNLTGEMADATLQTPAYWVRHIRQPVLFYKGLKQCLNTANCSLMELGPKPVLTGMAKQWVKMDQVFLVTMKPGQSQSALNAYNLALLYQQGRNINWSVYYQHRQVKKFPLPGYVFNRESFWVEDGADQFQNPVLAKPSLAHTNHSFLGQRQHSPLLQFEARWTDQHYEALAGHCIYHQVVTPAAVWIDMMLSVIAMQPDQEKFALQDFEITLPLVLKPATPCTIHTLLSPRINHTSQCLIYSESAAADQWQNHAQCQLTPATLSKTTVDLLKWDESQWQTQSDDFYQQLKTRQIDYGKDFRLIQAYHTVDQTAWVKIQRPDDNSDDDGQFPPALLDACIQSLALIYHQVEKSTGHHSLLLPTAIAYFQLFQPPANQIWCRTQGLTEQKPESQALMADIEIYNPDGAVVAILKGLKLIPVSKQAFNPSAMSHEKWLYQPIWQPQDEIVPKMSAETQHWLVISANNQQPEWMAAIDSRLIKGQWIDLAKPDWQQRLQQHRNTVTLVVFCASGDEKIVAVKGEPSAITAQKDCFDLLRLAQAMALIRFQSSPRLILITQNAQSVLADQADLNLSQAGLWGMTQSLRMELPEWQWGCIDIDAATHHETLITALQSQHHEAGVAFRNRERFVSRLMPYEPINSTDQAKFQLRSDGGYLITGGLGAIGWHVTEWLLAQGAQFIVLCGRRDLGPEQQQEIRDLEIRYTATLTYVKVDISRQQDVIQMIATIRKQAQPLAGIIHAAGVLCDGMLAQQDADHFKTVFAAKVHGSWNLHQATQADQLDFFVCMSSVASLVGSPGQANYATANAFMDALMAYRRLHQQPGMAINWGAWAGEGMLAELDQQQIQVMEKNGVTSFSAAAGIAVMEQLLAEAAIQVGVINIDWEKFWSQYGDHNPAYFEHFRSRQAAVATFAEDLKKSDPSLQKTLLLQHVREVLAAVLGRKNTTSLAVDKGFFEIGMDSLTAIELRNHLQRDLGCDLASTLAFDYPTINGLTDYLADQVLVLNTAQMAETETAMMNTHLEADAFDTLLVDDDDELVDAQLLMNGLEKLESLLRN